MSELLDELVSIWHAHRATILVVVFIAVNVARLYHVRAQHRRRIVDGKEEKTATRLGLADTEAQPPQLPTPASVSSKAAGPKRFTGAKKASSPATGQPQGFEIEPIILYFSLGGATARIAQDLAGSLESEATPDILPPQLHNIVEIDFDNFFVTPPKQPVRRKQFYLVLLPSYNIDSELNTFIDSLSETHHDFRIDTAPLRNLGGYAVFGFGDRQGWPTEEQGFCYQAVEVDKWMARLTGKKRAYPVGMADTMSEAKENLAQWSRNVVEVMQSLAAGRGLGEGVPGSGAALESGDEGSGSDAGDSSTETTRPQKKRKRRTVTTDLEDIRAPETLSDEIDFTTPSAQADPKEMVPVNSPTYTSLTKQGYTIVGSHSGVKICRWTKSALRGRGSCYKWSFYGIASHLCMETTPSLSCSNKCVFCWRHGTNPVSTTWRWTVDPPDLIFQGTKEGHYRKIKSMRGVPGVRAERFSEAMRIRHCALSLVGEPIFYPHINALLGMLHKERISTFLVCNAQHPDQLEALTQVTQLYVSIDASNKEALKKIDRPLHRDYWERFLRCMDILRAKRHMQRTVFRLTLVKGFNIDEEVEGYASLVERARPGLVEVKGVTYCGTSTSAAAGLTMQNVPFYEEVCAFVEKLNLALEQRGLGYGIAAEHAHSCCILLAEKERFHKDDGWHTLIDYQGFFACLESGNEFGPADYVGARTPEWALYGKGGFDPRDDRVDRKGRKKEGVVVVGGGKVVEL